jgi:Zierdtviridae DNA helicase
MRVQATAIKNRIHVRSQFGEIRDLHKKVPGANYSKIAGAWTTPLSMDSCRALREAFPDLEIMAPLWEWARTQVEREQRLGNLSRQLTGVELNRVSDYPHLSKAIASRPYQATAARFIAEGKTVLVADTPGLGKTTETIAGIIESGVPGPYLVVAPKTSLDVVWRREIEQRMPDDAFVCVARGSRAQRLNAIREALDPDWDQSSTWLVVTIESIRTQSWWVCACGARFKASDKPRSQVMGAHFIPGTTDTREVAGNIYPTGTVCGRNPRAAKTANEHVYPELFATQWGAIIMDESQLSLVRRSGTPTLVRSGARLLHTVEGGLKLALSGTPMRGKPQQLWGTLNWLRPDLYTGFWGWAERYWDVENDSYSREIGELRKDRLDSLYKSLDGLLIRRTKREVASELPPKQYMGTLLDSRDVDSPTAVWIDMEPEQARAYQEMLREGSARVLGGQLDAAGIIAELTRLKQFASCYAYVERVQKLIRPKADEEGMRSEPFYAEVTQSTPTFPSNKFEWIKQFLTERSIIDPSDEPSGKVVIVSQFTALLDLYANELRRLGVPVVMVTGAVTGGKRTRAVDTFNDQESDINVMLLNTKAGGVAITLDSADDMIFVDETHVPDDQEQAEERINNRRPEEKIATRRYWYLKSTGTVDAVIAMKNIAYDKDQKLLLDGRRGIAYYRGIFEWSEQT